MKKRLNVLCIVVIIVLSYSFFTGLYYFSLGVCAGLDMAKETQKSKQIMNMSITRVKLMPKSSLVFTDSLYNLKSHTKVPVMHSELEVKLNSSTCNIGTTITSALLSLSYMIAIVFSFYYFIKVISSINKSIIFDWKNVKRLRFLGTALLLSFLIDSIICVLELYKIKNTIEFAGYNIDGLDLLQTTNLILGLVSFIVAEIFAIALKMKEEQDLTI